MFVVRGLGEFDSQVKNWFGAVRQAAGEAAVGMAQVAFEDALEKSPQYSGAFVANWRLNVDEPDRTADHDPLGTKGQQPAPFQRSSEPAISYAKSKQAGKLRGFRLGQKIFVSNSTQGANEVDRKGFQGANGVDKKGLQATMFNNLAIRIEEGRIKLRPVNAGADHIASGAAQHVIRRFSHIGAVELETLRGKAK